MSGYIGADNTARKIKELYIGVGNTARVVQKAYIGVDNVARLWYTRGTQLGGLAVGSSVYFKVNNVRTEWLVVQQGTPNTSLYDSSCDGTWLLMKGLYATQPWDSAGNSYSAASIAASYLGTTFYNLIESGIRGKIKQVRIPYWNGKGNSGSLSVLAAGLSAKVFLLSGYEVGWTTTDNSYLPQDGAKLAYFGSDASRIALLSSGSANSWWTRSPSKANASAVVSVSGTGTILISQYSAYRGVRPCIVLPKGTLLDDNNNVIGG